MNALVEQLRTFGIGRLVAIFGVAAGVAAALVYFSSSMGASSPALLYAGLDPAAAAAAGQQLDEANLEYEFRDGGTAIYVPRDQVDEARVRVAAAGPLAGASVGYEIFDREDSFGQTSFVQNLNAKRALEGELARTIQSMDFITSARVHLNLPERRLFARDQQAPTASVTIDTRAQLSAEQVRVIRNIVASGAGLEPNNISLADDRGRLLASVGGDNSATSIAMDERQSGIETQLRQNILDLVEGVVGAGAARVQVTADLNRQSITESSETYDPDGAVVQSRDRRNESSSDQDGAGNRVSASENLPDAAGDTGGAPAATSLRETSNDVVSYALSSTTRTQITEAGAIERLSVAVAVDGILETQEDGSVVWRERSPEEISRIEALVRSAMGYVNVEDGRQDNLTVTQLEFARADPMLGTPATSSLNFSKSDVMRVAEIAVMFVTALLVIFLVARPLVKSAGMSAMPAGLALAGAGAGGGQPRLESGQVANALPGGGTAAIAAPSAADGIDISKIDGQVKASSIKKVASIVESHPEESISILRTWLHEG